MSKSPTITEKKPKASKMEKERADEQKDGFKSGVLWGSWREKKPSREFITGIANQLIEWCESEPEALRIEQFLQKHRLSLKGYFNWKAQSEDLEDAHEYAKMVIANRREVGAITRRLDSTALRMMHLYDKNWKDSLEWQSRLRNHEIAGQAITVVVPPMPSSEMVPHRELEDDKF